MMNNRPLVIFTARSRKDAVHQRAPMDIQGLFERLQASQALPVTHEAYMALRKAEQDDLKDVGGYVAGELKAGRRKAGAVLSRSAAVLDADNLPSGGTDEFIRRLEGLGCCYCVHSTAKHTPSTPRLRVVVPFSEDIPADQYAPAVRLLAQLIQREMDWFDPSTDEAGRIMYWAAHCEDVTPVFQAADKPLLNAAVLLSQLPDWRDVTTWPHFPREKAPAKLAAKQEDPTTKSGIVGAFCRVYDVPGAMARFLPGVYEETPQEGRYTFSAGSTAGGAVVYEGGKFLFSHHATDPAGGRLVNAFDLVRLHKYAALDDEAKAGTPPARLPSYTAMCAEAAADPAVSDLLARERVAAAFSPVMPAADEDAALALGRCAGAFLSLAVIKTALKAMGIQVKQNLITGRAEIDGLPAEYSSGNAVNILPMLIMDKLRAVGVKGASESMISKYLGVVCDENRYNPVLDMLGGTAWDGCTRFPQLLQVVGLDPGSLAAVLLRKWLMQCVAMAHNTAERREAAEGVLTLQGPQGVGKTLLCRRLSIRPEWFAEGVTLDLKNKDQIINATGAWITELGELDSTLKRDQSSLKAFITSPSDRVRAPYAREASFLPRYTSFCATVNPGEFLRDETGDRRFWVIPAENIDLHALLSLPPAWFEQLWAEAAVWWKESPQGFRLSGLEREALDKSNSKYREALPGEEELRQAFNFDLERDRWGEFSASQLRGMLYGIQSGGISARQLGRVLAKLEREDKRITSRILRGIRKYRLPLLQAGQSLAGVR